jgi:hypothetical protein
MSVSLEYLQRCSAGTGYQVWVLEKVVRLGELAGEVGRHPFLGAVLALKGGTALNLCFGPPARLSVDLDFNYIGSVGREKMLEDRPGVEDAATELARRLGYRIQRSADAFAGRKIYLIYRSVLGQEDRIEMDLNFLFRLPIAGTQLREMWQPGELDRPRIRAVSLEEILIGKLLALLDRGAPRDVWDVANLPDAAKDVLRSPMFKAHFIALAAVLDHPLPSYTRDRLEALVSERSIAEHLSPTLAKTETLQVSDLIERAWKVVKMFLPLGKNEQDYIHAIQEGKVRSDLLFPEDSEETTRMAAHPAILWKVANVREHIHKGAKKGKG